MRFGKLGLAAALTSAGMLVASPGPEQTAIRQEAAKPRERLLFGRKKKKSEKRKERLRLQRRQRVRETTGDPYYGIPTRGRRFATENYEAQMRAQRNSRQWLQANA